MQCPPMPHRHVPKATDDISLLRIQFVKKENGHRNIFIPTSIISGMLSTAPDEVVPTVATGQ